jgi:hypothetical protein
VFWLFKKICRVAAELTSALNSLKTAINTQSKPASTIVSAANTSNDIKTKVSRISDLLAEAISSREQTSIKQLYNPGIGSI